MKKRNLTKPVRRLFCIGLLSGMLAPFMGHAQNKATDKEQFVLFDVQFTYTKNDADHATPSKSHFYVKEGLINPHRPQNWVNPVNYRDGKVHIRIEVIDKPEGGFPTTWTLCYIPNKGQGNGYGCTSTGLFTEKGIYERDEDMHAFWENEAIIWTEGIKQMDLVIKDDSGGQGHAHKRTDHEHFFPATVRISMVQVAAGFEYNPSLFPQKPAIPVE